MKEGWAPEFVKIYRSIHCIIIACNLQHDHSMLSMFYKKFWYHPTESFNQFVQNCYIAAKGYVEHIVQFGELECNKNAAKKLMFFRKSLFKWIK